MWVTFLQPGTNALWCCEWLKYIAWHQGPLNRWQVLFGWKEFGWPSNPWGAPRQIEELDLQTLCGWSPLSRTIKATWNSVIMTTESIWKPHHCKSYRGACPHSVKLHTQLIYIIPFGSARLCHFHVMNWLHGNTIRSKLKLSRNTARLVR